MNGLWIALGIWLTGGVLCIVWLWYVTRKREMPEGEFRARCSRNSPGENYGCGSDNCKDCAFLRRE